MAQPLVAAAPRLVSALRNHAPPGRIAGGRAWCWVLPMLSASRLLQSLKGATQRQANLILGRTGETFWQAESYDHWVPDASEWRRIASYIGNPGPERRDESRRGSHEWLRHVQQSRISCIKGLRLIVAPVGARAGRGRPPHIPAHSRLRVPEPFAHALPRPVRSTYRPEVLGKCVFFPIVCL